MLLAPPVRLDRRERLVLGLLGVVSVGTSFQGSLPSASLTYAAKQWGASTADQARALAFIRADVVLTVLLVRLADRVGRRRVIRWTALLGPLGTAACAASPNLAVFTVLQVVARGFVTTTAVLIAVYAVEEMRAQNRTWASGFLVATAAVGSAAAVGSVAIADVGPSVWRVLYLFPLLPAAVVLLLGRRLPETNRFLSVRHEGRRVELVAGLRRHRARLIPLALFLAMLAFENAPTRQLQNEFLRLDQGYSSKAVAMFSVFSNAPGVIGLAVGTMLGQRLGHRRTLLVACLGYGTCDALMFLSDGWMVWGWSIVGALLGGAALPILGVLSAELFPTAFRSTANGVTLAASRLGGALGLLGVGWATGPWGRGPALASTSLLIGLAMLLLVRLPETGGRSLEEINPDDALAPGREASTP